MAKVIELEVVRTIAPIDPSTLDDPVGAPALPPRDWFVKPDDLPEDAKITVDFETGRVFGRVAPRKQCLLSQPGQCWTISDSPTNFRGAQQGDTVLDDGGIIRTANIGGTVRHAPDGRDGKPAASFVEAVDWYENTASRLMRVRFGADEHGIWLAGALLPHVTKRTALDVMQSPVSGDWRWREELDDYDMAGVVLVNMPGFPLGVRARAASAWREPLIGTWDEVAAMVASLDAPSGTVTDVPAAPSASEVSPSGSCECGGHTEPMVAATFTAGQRRKLAGTGAAMKDGSFPIRNRSDLQNAIQAFGRAGNKAAAKRHIIKRARALGLTSLLPESWNVSTASPGTDEADPNDVAATFEPVESFTKDEVQEMITAAIAPLQETITAQGSVIDALAAMAGDSMDATIGVADAV